MDQPDNTALLEEIAHLRKQMDLLTRNLPALAKLSSDSELRRERAAFEEKRKSGIRRKTAQLCDVPRHRQAVDGDG